MSLELMLANCKTEAELRMFCVAQQKTLTAIMKKNQEYKEEIDHLKKVVVNGALPIISNSESSVLLSNTPEEEIAKIELNKLKHISMEPELLTLEEAKKVEIYSKILASKNDGKKSKEERDVRELDESILIAQLESPDEKKSNE